MFKTIFKKVFHRLGIAIKPVPKKHFFSGNSMVDVKIGNYYIKINKNHSLPFNIRTFPQYNQNLPRLAKWLYDKLGKFTLIDVGANVGDTVAYIKNMVDIPVICFEGDDQYFDLLQSNTQQFNEVQIVRQYLAEKTQTVNISVSSKGGTAHIEEQAAGKLQIQLKSLDDFFAEHGQLAAQARIIKVDTDGFDTKILKGAWQTLTVHKPILFFEYDPVFLEKQQESGLIFLKSLQEIGYSRILFYDNYGRLVVGLNLKNWEAIENMHNYIAAYKGAFEFYDVCIFHETQDALGAEFQMLESNLNIEKGK